MTSDTPPVHIIVAAAKNRVIGDNGRLVWNIPEDWQYFLNSTNQSTLLLGRICFEELQEKGITKDTSRTFVVVSRKRELQSGNVIVVSNTQEALKAAKAIGKTIWIAGGVRIYEECLKIADKLYITCIDAEFKGDVFFPEWNNDFPELISEEKKSNSALSYSFRIYKRSDD